MSLELSRFSSLVALLFVSVAACGGGDDGGDDDGVSAACQEAVDHSDLEWIQQRVFTQSCSLSTACHGGNANQAQDLNLEAGMSEANLVGVPAKGEFAEGLDLVEAGQPDQSYLMVVLGKFGDDDPRLPEDTAGNKITMPDGQDPLCQEKLDAIERWITDL